MKCLQVFIFEFGNLIYSVRGQSPDQSVDPFKIHYLPSSYIMVLSIPMSLAGYNMPLILLRLLKNDLLLVKGLHDYDTSDLVISSNDWLA